MLNQPQESLMLRCNLLVDVTAGPNNTTVYSQWRQFLVSKKINTDGSGLGWITSEMSLGADGPTISYTFLGQVFLYFETAIVPIL